MARQIPMLDPPQGPGAPKDHDGSAAGATSGFPSGAEILAGDHHDRNAPDVIGARR